MPNMKNEANKRASNFTIPEEDQLLCILKKYSGIIECKRSDAVMNSDKLEVWKKVENEFNSKIINEYRSVKCLKSKYENLKKQTKRKYADQKSYIRGTGGGPSCNSTMSSRDVDIQNILGTRVTGLLSEFDADSEGNVGDAEENSVVFEADFQAESQDILGTQTCLLTEPFQDSMDNDCSTSATDIDKHNMSLVVMDDHESPIIPAVSGRKFQASKLKRPISEKLQTHKKLPSTNLDGKLKTWAIAKVELAEMQKNAFLEESNEKLRHLKQMNSIDKQHKLEIHNLQLELLKAQLKKIEEN